MKETELESTKLMTKTFYELSEFHAQITDRLSEAEDIIFNGIAHEIWLFLEKNK